jgi:DeoR family transcriptional regulator, suf operon transcriptional repressor
MIYSLEMGSTRNLVLKHMLSQQRSTINDLAKAVKINPISVRHHITKLEDEGMVASAEERHGVGRPRRVYFLTETGMEHFPGHTIQFTNRLIDQMKQHLPEATVGKLFDGMASSVLAGYPEQAELDKMSLDERLRMMKQRMTSEGFNVQIQRNAEEIIIKETSCPYYYVGQTHAEVCSIDKAMIAKALSVDPERTSCVLSGDSHCTYVVSISAIKESIPS